MGGQGGQGGQDRREGRFGEASGSVYPTHLGGIPCCLTAGSSSFQWFLGCLFRKLVKGVSASSPLAV